MVHVNRAELFVTRGQIERAREACDRAHALARGVELQPAVAEIYCWYSVIERESDEPVRAERYLQQAFDIACEHAMPLLRAEARREMALLYRRQRRDRDALDALLEIMDGMSGIKLDPRVFAAFRRMIDDHAFPALRVAA